MGAANPLPVLADGVDSGSGRDQPLTDAVA
jgi:hypothetical protein